MGSNYILGSPIVNQQAIYSISTLGCQLLYTCIDEENNLCKASNSKVNDLINIYNDDSSFTYGGLDSKVIVGVRYTVKIKVSVAN